MSDYKRITNRETKYLDGEIVCPELARLQELENKIENGTLVELPKPKWAVVQSIGGNYSVRKREPCAEYYEGGWYFYYEDFDWVIIRFEYDTKPKAEAKLRELKGEN